MSAVEISVPDKKQARLLKDARENPSPFLIETTGDVDYAASAWAELEGAGCVFQSRAWLATWRCTIGRAIGAEPCFLIVRDRGTRRLAAFFPLSIRRRFGVRVVEFCDFGVTDYNAPLCAPDCEFSDADLAALWRQGRMAIPGADVFLFEKLPEAICGRPMPFARLGWLEPMELRCWTLALPASRELFDQTLRTKDRKEQRRKRRNLVEKLGEPVVIEAATREEAAETFGLLRKMRAERFRRLGRRDLLKAPVFARFYEALATHDDPGLVSLARVKAGDRDIAALMALRHADAYVLIMHSFAADLESLSPGVVAIDQLITHLIDDGVRHCDFTTGNEAYKKQFGVSECGMRQGMDAVTLRGRLFAAAYRAAGSVRAAAVKALGKYARELRRLRG